MIFPEFPDDIFDEEPNFSLDFELDDSEKKSENTDEKLLEPPCKKQRFVKLSECQLGEIVETSTAAATKYQTKWALSVFEGK